MTRCSPIRLALCLNSGQVQYYYTVHIEFCHSEDILSAPLIIVLIIFVMAAVRGHHRPPPSKARTKQITVSTATAAVQSKSATQRSIPPSIPSNPPTPGPSPRPPTPGPAHSRTPPPPPPVYAPQVSPVKSHITPLPSSPHRRKLVVP